MDGDPEGDPIDFAIRVLEEAEAREKAMTEEMERMAREVRRLEEEKNKMATSEAGDKAALRAEIEALEASIANATISEKKRKKKKRAEAQRLPFDPEKEGYILASLVEKKMRDSAQAADSARAALKEAESTIRALQDELRDTKQALVDAHAGKKAVMTTKGVDFLTYDSRLAAGNVCGVQGCRSGVVKTFSCNGMTYMACQSHGSGWDDGGVYSGEAPVFLPARRSAKRRKKLSYK